jgi:glycosyltransferase involved in cell wall biosynthesis
MPVAEAIIAGRPVLCSAAASLPEIAGDAALTFDPHDAASIARTMLRLFKDPQVAAHLAHAAGGRRRLFSAKRSAVETMSIYHRVFGETYADPK